MLCALKNAPRAIISLLVAVNLNPALPLSWKMLEGVYRLSGDLRTPPWPAIMWPHSNTCRTRLCPRPPFSPTAISTERKPSFARS